MSQQFGPLTIDTTKSMISSLVAVTAPNMDLLKASFKIPYDPNYPVVETLAPLIFAPDQAPSMLIPAGYFRAGSVRQVSVTLRVGHNSRYPSSGLLLYLRENSSNNGIGLDGQILAQCVIDMTQIQNGQSNRSQDVTIMAWIATRAGGTDSAVPLRSHMTYQVQSVAYNVTQGATYQQPSGSGGYENSTAVIDGTVDHTLYLSYKWEAPLQNFNVGYFPTDGKEWVIVGKYQISRSTNGSLGMLTVDNPGTSSGESLYGVDCSADRAIAVGTSGIIRVAGNGGAQKWSARYNPAGSANALRGVFFASWLGINGRWIVSGDGGVILTSDDGGNSWIQRTSGITDQLQCISGSATAGIFIATTTSAGRFLKSSDGITWTLDTARSAAGTIKCVRVIGNTIVFGGTVGKLTYSTDGGSTWTDKTSGIGTNSFVGVDYDATLSIWVIISANGGYYATTPGGTWTAITGITSINIQQMRSSGLGKFVAVDASGIIWQSINGTSFIDQTTTQSGSGAFWGDFGEFRV